jgi:hypothetical protein
MWPRNVLDVPDADSIGGMMVHVDAVPKSFSVAISMARQTGLNPGRRG